MREVAQALEAYRRKWGFYPRALWQLQPHYLAGNGRVSCPMEAHLAWDLTYFEPGWSPEDGLTHRILRADRPAPRPVPENDAPLAWTLSLLVLQGQQIPFPGCVAGRHRGSLEHG